MALSSIALCSRALMKLGADVITSFEEGTAESEVAATLYGSLRDALISAYPWSFATSQTWLSQLAEKPIADYEFAYQLPSDFLRALSAGVSGRGRGIEYRIAERRLHTDALEVALTYIFRPAESEFPPFFDQALIARLAAEFCIPLTDSTSRAETLAKLAENEYSRAKQIDAQQETPGRIEDFTLVEVRS
ncbi:MAG: hypothetical protein O2944_09220 [Proteobacteria bacterium]|nr:hypothetical protein [Pseudomonadota bacterium]